MPLGDPHGGNFEYTDEGLPETLFSVVVRVSDIGKSVNFYRDTLKFELLGTVSDRVFIRRENCTLILQPSDTVAKSEIFLGVDSPYNSRRRLIDEDVRFASDPARGPLGTSVSIYDPDGNIITLIEKHGEFRVRNFS